MPQYEYNGYDKAGARVSGSITAESLSAAQQLLKKQGLLLKSVKEEQLNQQAALFSTDKIGIADIEFLTAELSLLLDSGLKIDKGIELLKSANKKPSLARLLNKISTELRSGKQLSQVLAGSPIISMPCTSIWSASAKKPVSCQMCFVNWRVTWRSDAICRKRSHKH